MRDQDLVVALVVIGIIVAVITGVNRRRDGIKYALDGVAVALVIGILATAVAESQGIRGDGSVLAGFLAGLLALSLMPRRSRHIPRRVRRAVVAKWERETGEKYSSRKHELDHDVPFARGGSHTEDNLRVRTKRANRRKGAKSPWWDLLGN